jgi:AcrR family transcriptional regulator
LERPVARQPEGGYRHEGQCFEERRSDTESDRRSDLRHRCHRDRSPSGRRDRRRPTVYVYFESKNAIYDAMFAQAATAFADLITQPDGSKDPRAVLTESLHRFVLFCTSDVARFHLLFQRPMPDFEPSAVSLAPAIVAFDAMRERLALNDITDPAHIDMWTALTTGLVSQQVANDPGGDRWTRLIDDVVGMFLAYCQPVRRRRSSTR